MPPKYLFKAGTFLGSRNFCIINPHSEYHTIPPSQKHIEVFGSKGDSYRQFVAIDVGCINTAIYIERTWNNGVEEYVDCILFKPLEHESNEIDDIMTGGDKFIAEFKDLFRQSHYILIESQVLGNNNAIRLMQHYISLIRDRVRNKGFRPLLFEFNPALKTKLLGAPKEIKTKPQRKKWCVLKAQEILDERGEHEITEEIFLRRRKNGEGKNKKDDVADCICMIRAFKKIWSETSDWKTFLKEKV